MSQWRDAARRLQRGGGWESVSIVPECGDDAAVGVVGSSGKIFDDIEVVVLRHECDDIGFVTADRCVERLQLPDDREDSADVGSNDDFVFGERRGVDDGFGSFVCVSLEPDAVKELSQACRASLLRDVEAGVFREELQQKFGVRLGRFEL